jgi:hypothetical protein
MDATRPTPPPALLVSSVLPLILREEHGERLEVDDKMMRIEENDYSQIICGTEERNLAEMEWKSTITQTPKERKRRAAQ